MVSVTYFIYGAGSGLRETAYGLQQKMRKKRSGRKRSISKYQYFLKDKDGGGWKYKEVTNIVRRGNTGGKKGEMHEITSNSNPFSNLDTSSPKVNHSHVLKVLLHTYGFLFLNLG